MSTQPRLWNGEAWVTVDEFRRRVTRLGIAAAIAVPVVLVGVWAVGALAGGGRQTEAAIACEQAVMDARNMSQATFSSSVSGSGPWSVRGTVGGEPYACSVQMQDGALVATLRP